MKLIPLRSNNEIQKSGVSNLEEGIKIIFLKTRRAKNLESIKCAWKMDVMF